MHALFLFLITLLLISWILDSMQASHATPENIAARWILGSFACWSVIELGCHLAALTH